MWVTAKGSGKSQALEDQYCMAQHTGKVTAWVALPGRKKGAELHCAVNEEEEEAGGRWCVWKGTRGKQSVSSAV